MNVFVSVNSMIVFMIVEDKGFFVVFVEFEF